MDKILKLNFEPSTNYIREHETLLNSLYSLQYTSNKKIPTFTFGISSQSNNTIFYIVIPEEYEYIFKNKYAAIDPYIQFEEIKDPIMEFKDNLDYVEGYSMNLMYNDPNKILSVQDNKGFLNNLLHSMNNIDTNDKSIIEISIKPVINYKSNNKTNNKFNALITVGNLFFKGVSILLDETIMNGQMSEINNKEEVDDLNKDIILYSKFKVNIKLLSKSDNVNNRLNNIKSMAAVFQDLTSTNSLIPSNIKKENINREATRNEMYVSEIVQFLHLPDKSVSSSNIITSNCKKVYDRNVPSKGIIFGNSNGNPVAFNAVPLSVDNYKEKYNEVKNIVDNLSKPCLILGQQGTGKSEWIINYVISIAKLGLGVIVVDPKNDTQQRLIESLPEDLIDRLVYINLGDTIHPPSFNLFKKRHENDPTENSLIVTSFISLMKKESPHWGFKMQKLCQMTAEAILLNDICTLNEFELMLTERVYRESMITIMRGMLKDPERKGKSHIKKLLKYWENFNEMTDKNIWKEIEPVMNIIGPFLSNRIIKSIVSQTDSFDFREAANQGKIVIINIPEGILRENTRLLSSMINKSIWLDIQSRADMDISERYPIEWVIDEAHEIVDDEFISVLTKARAYRLGLTLVTQGLTNFKMRNMDNIKELITTNCKNKILFRLGTFDSRELSEEFSPLTFSDLNNCPDYHFYGKILLSDGSVSNSFFSKAPMPAKKIRNYDDFVKKHQSGRFSIDEIEDELDDRLDSLIVYQNLL